MNTIVHFLSVAAIAAAVCSCGNKDLQVNTRISDNLFGIEYDDFDFEAGVAALDKYKPASFGCSEVRKGDFVGRNLDWYINNEASIILKVNASESRYASIGIGGCFPLFTNELAASGEYDPIYEILPMFTTDGINEKGLYVGVNVMPTGETSFDKEKWNSGAWGNGAAMTNPGAEKSYCTMYMVRFLLDNAASVEEAKTLVESSNWYEPSGFPHDGQSQAFHWLVCDASSSMVLEFIDNQPYFTETDKVNEPSFATIMTNFTNRLYADGIMQKSGIGYERWDILAAGYPAAAESFEGIADLMKTVWYSNFYTTPAGDPNFFMTDLDGVHPSWDVYHNAALWDDPEWLSYVARTKEKWNDPSFWHTDDTSLWYTTHTSVYSISGRELMVLTHEGLESQKEYYKVNFESTFAKPLALKK